MDVSWTTRSALLFRNESVQLDWSFRNHSGINRCIQKPIKNSINYAGLNRGLPVITELSNLIYIHLNSNKKIKNSKALQKFRFCIFCLKFLKEVSNAYQG